ncbi:MAG: DUF2017 family protein [Actinomycetota bacterium]
MYEEPFTPLDDGSLAVRLSREEADALRRVAADILEELADTGDPGLRRLFPPAYENDPEREEEFAAMTRDDLLERKRNAAKAVVDSIDGGKVRKGMWSARLDEENQQAWLALVNDARLVLGTRLDVTEEMDHEPLPSEDARAPLHNLYVYLSALEWALVEALAVGLPPAGTD